MPCYDFVCPQCGIVEQAFPMSQAPDIGEERPCPQCGKPAKRVFSRVHAYGDDHVRYSRALAVPADWVRDGTANTIHPNANWKISGGVALLEIRNRQDKLKRMKERSKVEGKQWVEYD